MSLDVERKYIRALEEIQELREDKGKLINTLKRERREREDDRLLRRYNFRLRWVEECLAELTQKVDSMWEGGWDEPR